MNAGGRKQAIAAITLLAILLKNTEYFKNAYTPGSV